MLNGAAPAFAVEGGWPLLLARGLWVAALLSAFGSLLFRAVAAPHALRLLPADEAVAAGARLDRISGISLGVALAAGCAWLLAMAGSMASADTLVQAAAAVPTVLTDTDFGHVLIAQLAAAVLAVLLPGGGRNPARRWAALAACAAATVLQAGHGHAASMYDGPSWLLLVAVVHLLGAGGWLGGLLPLLLLVRTTPVKPAVTAARYFSPLGKICVAAVALSAAWQGWVLVGSIPALVGTAYGWVVLVKMLLLAVLTGFALANRYRFAPALLHGDPAAARRTLVRSIAVQTGVSLAVIAAAAVLSSLAPSMHVQPVWPFTERFSLDTIQEDPDFRREVIEAALALAGAVALLMLAALLRRRVSILAVIAAAVIAWFAIPHFDLLLVEAYPTSFYHSPTGFAAASITQGAALFPGHCAACHGAQGHGDGPAAKGLPVPPADLTAAHLWDHSDGELFWWLTHGIDAPEGGQAMPGFGTALTEDQRWALIDFIRANNAGAAKAATGQWPLPVHAPGFEASCGGRTVTLDDLPGRVVRFIIGPPRPLPPNPDVITIFATPTADPAACTVIDLTVPQAYAIVSGIPAGALPGTEFLIDGDGWLRAAQRSGWDDPKALAAAVASLRAHPMAAPAPMAMDMKM